MYDPIKIQEGFRSLVGIRQSNVPGVPKVKPPLSISLTNKWVDGKNSLAATENMYYSCPNFDPVVYPLWKSGSDYSKDDKVNSSGVIFNANSNITNDIVTPQNDATNWTVYDPFNAWLQQIVDQGADNLISYVIREKKLQHMARAIVERLELYRGGASVHSKIIGSGRFVGFQIIPEQAEGLWVYLNDIGIQLSQPQNLKFYLYHSESYAPIGIWNVPVSNANTFSWNDLTSATLFVSGDSFVTGQVILYSTNGNYYSANGNLPSYTGNPSTDTANWTLTSKPNDNCILKYFAQNTSGSYFFGYYESDLVGNALSKSWDCTSVPCAACDGLDISAYNQWSRYTTFVNIQVPASGLNAERNLFDTSMVTNGTISNWGMNFRVTVRCNLTDFILDNLHAFADPLQMQLCKEFLEIISNGIRIGPSPAQTKLSAIAALDSKSPGNWISKYQQSIDALNLDMSGFSESCMPCDKKNKATFFTM